MKDQALWFLENIDVTGIFCPKKLGSGAFHVDKRYRKGEYVYMPDDAADKIFFLFDGRIKIGAYGDSGKEITKAILGRGEVFGELAVLGEKTRRDFAQAMEDTTVCMISANEMKTLMQDHSTLSLFLMKMMGSRMLEMENRLEALVFKDSRTRIIEFIRDLAQKKGQRVGYETLVRKFLTHQEIANLTATSRQTVTTVLNDLRNKNILTFNRRRLLVRDMKLLEQEAGLVA